MPQEDDRLELRSPRVSDYASGISRPPTRAAEAAAAEAAAAEAAAASALQSTSRTATDHVSQASDGGSTEASLVSSGGPAAGPLERRGRYGSGRALERGGRHLPRQRRAGGARHDPRLLPIRLQAGVARLRAGRLYVHRRRAGRPHARHAPPQVKSELKSKQVKTMEVVPVFKRGRFDLLSGDPPPYPTTVQLLGEDGGVGHAVTIVRPWIFDATLPHALPLSRASLDECCSSARGGVAYVSGVRAVRYRQVASSGVSSL